MERGRPEKEDVHCAYIVSEGKGMVTSEEKTVCYLRGFEEWKDTFALKALVEFCVFMMTKCKSCYT